MNNDYGILLNEHNIKLQRSYFDQMVRLLGVNVKYFPLINKQWSEYSEIIAHPEYGITIGCIFTDHIDQRTQKKLGWNSELVEGALLANLPYNTPDIQVGCLILIPSGIDNTPPRLFRITRMSTIMIYPASIACECVPEYANSIPASHTEDFVNSSMQVLMKDPDDNL